MNGWLKISKKLKRGSGSKTADLIAYYFHCGDIFQYKLCLLRPAMAVHETS